jgi:hypothetical protein
MAIWSDFQFWERASIKEKSNCYALFHQEIRLGRGIGRGAHQRDNTAFEENFILEAIVQMGFRKEDILKVNPSSYDLLEICSELKTFGFSIRYQKLLEENTNGSKPSHDMFFQLRGRRKYQKQ